MPGSPAGFGLAATAEQYEEYWWYPSALSEELTASFWADGNRWISTDHYFKSLNYIHTSFVIFSEDISQIICSFLFFLSFLHVPKINATFWVFCRSDGSDLASWMMQIHILKSNPCFSPDVLNSMETTKETTKNGLASQEDYSSGFIGTGPLECPLETSCWFDCWPFWGDPTPTFSTWIDLKWIQSVWPKKACWVATLVTCCILFSYL